MKAVERYAILGWPVFITTADARTPPKGGGYDSATADPEEFVRRWQSLFGGRPCNLALACGGPSGVFALDEDVKHGDGRATLAKLEEANGRLPDCPIQATPSGGRHLIFRQPNRDLRNRVNFAPHLDIRTTRGSIALAPSSRADGAYRWLVSPAEISPPEAPAWLLDLIDPPAPPRRPAPPLRFSSTDRAARYAAAAVEAEVRRVSTTKTGGRNQTLFEAAANLGELVEGGLLPLDLAERALEDAAEQCGLVRENGSRGVRATIQSGIKRGRSNPREVEGLQ